MSELILRPLAEVSESDLSALSDEAFGDEEPSVLLAKVLEAEAEAGKVRGDTEVPGAFGLAAFRDNTLVGWTNGHRVGKNQFYMLNSGVANSARRSGVYTQLVLAVLDHAQAQGYATVKSLHVAANSPVIIAKMRLGFFISGFEYSEVYGPLVQLKYFVGDARRSLYKTRTTSIRPAER